jgi:branched-chain amino acid transport system ATP-binding protein
VSPTPAARTRRKAVPERGTDPAEPPILQLQGMRAAYGTVEVLHGVDMAVPAGRVTAVLGPNGAGKSTTLRVIGGLLAPTAGRVLIGGCDVAGVPPERRTRAGMCLLPEGRAIFPNLTVRENLLMDTYSSGRSLDEVEEIVYRRFPRLGQRRSQTAGTLSGGEQQMLSLGRTVSSDPAVILIDELSMGLAPVIVQELFGVVAQLAAEGVTIVLVEQLIGAALDLADHVVAMSRGQVTLAGPPATVVDELSSVYLGATA